MKPPNKLECSSLTSLSTRMCLGHMFFGQMSSGQRTLGQMPLGQMPLGQMSVGPNAFRPNVCWPNVCWPKAFRPKAFRPKAFRPKAFRPNAFRPNVFRQMFVSHNVHQSHLIFSIFMLQQFPSRVGKVCLWWPNQLNLPQTNLSYNDKTWTEFTTLEGSIREGPALLPQQLNSLA